MASRVRAAGLGVVLVLVVSACATVPTGGAVQPGQAGAGGDRRNEPYIRLIPPSPQPGDSQTTVVKGFLAALASFEGDHRAARAYLTPDQRRSWRPSRQVRVYDDAADFVVEPPTPYGGEGAQVDVSASQVAQINPNGRYDVSTLGDDLRERFRLRKVGKEWRISEPPQILMLSRRDVDRAYRPLNLYFFGSDMRSLVPDPVMVPVYARGDIAATLAEALLRGPTSWLAPAVRTAFPAGTRVAGVTSSATTITVELTGTVSRASQDALSDMSAQLMWTLKQLPEMQELKLLVNGEPVRVPGADEEGVQDKGDWMVHDPNVLTSRAHTYYVRDGRLWYSENGEGKHAPGGLGEAAAGPISRPAVMLDEGRAAALTPDGHGVLVADLTVGSRVSQPLFGGTYVSLSWDRFENLWVAERYGKGTRLWLLRGGGRPVEVPAPELREVAVKELDVARDGARLAIVHDSGRRSQIEIGRVVQAGGKTQAEGFFPLGSELAEVTSLAWRDADQLAVLGQGSEGATQPYLVYVDGTRVQGVSAAPGGEMAAIAAAPGQPLLSGVEDGHVWRTGDRLIWQRLADGADPVYPG
ncbi:MAG: hypothetical protein GEV11_15425 [Streptosporangiales bacterium]|nr:hypothetical protein [Streptosporangiales bacterium]